jgi:hypothetical protein
MHWVDILEDLCGTGVKANRPFLINPCLFIEVEKTCLFDALRQRVGNVHASNSFCARALAFLFFDCVLCCIDAATSKSGCDFRRLIEPEP